jgi:hypothetical protein
VTSRKRRAGAGAETTVENGVCPADPAKPLLEPEALTVTNTELDDPAKPQAHNWQPGDHQRRRHDRLVHGRPVAGRHPERPAEGHPDPDRRGRRTGTITVTFTPTAPKGTVVSGHLYVDQRDLQINEVIPQTIRATPTSTAVS